MATSSSSSSSKLPPPSANQVYVQVSALEAGHLTLPEHLFVTDAEPEKWVTVPSLSFLVRHPTGPSTLVFDLGIKRDLTAYPVAMHAHIANRRPCGAEPDAAASLRADGMDEKTDIDYVVLSHCHWDHVGTPADFVNSRFVVGSGTLHLLEHGAPPHYPADTFDPDLLPRDRTLELPPVSSSSTTAAPAEQQTHHHWAPLSTLSHTVDFFGDGSFYLVDAPGHLYGHLNALARLGPNRWVYLGGDCCHDIRILEGSKGIGTYPDGHGGMRSVHVDTDQARRTVDGIREFLDVNAGENGTVEVVIAHDWKWREDGLKRGRFLPGVL